MNTASKSIVVVGAGISGLVAASDLVRAGHNVVVLEKSRGPGGRMSTRRGETGARLDHGCQFISCDSNTDTQYKAWMASGLVGSWNPRIAPGTSLPEFAGEKWTIGIPTMSAVARKLADGIEVKTEWRVESITCKQDRWSLLESDKKRRIEADLVVMAIPAPQAACLLAHTEFAHLRKIKSVSYDPIWSLLLEADEIPELSYDMYGSDTEPLQWLVSQSSRQGRSKLPAWVGLASRSWSGEHLEDDPLVVRDVLMNSVNRMTGENWACPGSVHRWRYGLVEHALGEPSLSDTDLGIFACGDWCLGPSVEHAIRSGHHVANQIALAVAS